MKIEQKQYKKNTLMKKVKRLQKYIDTQAWSISYGCYWEKDIRNINPIIIDSLIQIHLKNHITQILKKELTVDWPYKQDINKTYTIHPLDYDQIINVFFLNDYIINNDTYNNTQTKKDFQQHKNNIVILCKQNFSIETIVQRKNTIHELNTSYTTKDDFFYTMLGFTQEQKDYAQLYTALYCELQLYKENYANGFRSLLPSEKKDHNVCFNLLMQKKFFTPEILFKLDIDQMSNPGSHFFDCDIRCLIYFYLMSFFSWDDINHMSLKNIKKIENVFKTYATKESLAHNFELSRRKYGSTTKKNLPDMFNRIKLNTPLLNKKINLNVLKNKIHQSKYLLHSYIYNDVLKELA